MLYWWEMFSIDPAFRTGVIVGVVLGMIGVGLTMWVISAFDKPKE